MKQSIRTAESIYNEIKRLTDEMVELNRGLQELEDSQGKLPYQLIAKALDDKKAELAKAKRQTFLAATTHEGL